MPKAKSNLKTKFNLATYLKYMTHSCERPDRAWDLESFLESASGGTNKQKIRAIRELAGEVSASFEDQVKSTDPEYLDSAYLDTILDCLTRLLHNLASDGDLL